MENKLADNEDTVLMEPYRYLAEIPGKGVRSQLIKAFNQWLNIDHQQLVAITGIIQMLHTASLLIDDIEDNSKLRRGIPVAHIVYGVPATINSANYVYFVALRECNKLGNEEATKVFIEELVNLHRGQGFDIFWRDNNQCPTEDQYKQMVIEKTGGLFRLAVRMMQAFSKNKMDFNPLVNYLGLYFQIRDDYMNLQSEQYMQNKSFCEDLTEGKFSFPIVHSILSTPTDSKLLKILKQKPTDVEIKRYALGIMEKTGSFEYTKVILKEYEVKILEEIKKLGGNTTLTSLVEHLAKLDK